MGQLVPLKAKITNVFVTGGWWFVLCGVGNLNGIYGQGNAHRGIFWYPYQNRYDDNFVKSVMKMTRG